MAGASGRAEEPGRSQVMTARSQTLTVRSAGKSDLGSLNPDNLGGVPPVVTPLGTFLGKEASDDAKTMWSAYRSQLHSRVVGDVPPALGLAAVNGNIAQRQRPAPNLPKPGGPDDPGRAVKDWNYYSYHPRGTLSCPQNQYGTAAGGRWPGLNHTPVTRHHLVLRPGTVGASRKLPHTVWTGHPSLDAGPGEKPIAVKLKREEQERQVVIDQLARHREVLRRQMATRVMERTQLQMMSSQHVPR
jgi:hypothetical protein